MPGMSGIGLLRTLNQLYPTLPILIVSGQDELAYATRTFKLGARGYVDKANVVSMLVKAIRQVLCGIRYVSKGVADYESQPHGRGNLR